MTKPSPFGTYPSLPEMHLSSDKENFWSGMVEAILSHSGGFVVLEGVQLLPLETDCQNDRIAKKGRWMQGKTQFGGGRRGRVDTECKLVEEGVDGLGVASIYVSQMGWVGLIINDVVLPFELGSTSWGKSVMKKGGIM